MKSMSIASLQLFQYNLKDEKCFNQETTYCPLYSTRTTDRQEQPKENTGDIEYYHNPQQTE